jgi:hypothetical protein
VRECVGYGVKALAVTLDGAKWTAVITSGLKQKHLSLP